MEENKRKKYSLFYKDEIIEIYKILKDETITDKEKAINYYGSITKLISSIEKGIYKDIDNEISYIKEWVNENCHEEKMGNQYSKSFANKRVKLLLKLNRLYINNQLNENTYYEIYNEFDSYYDIKSILINLINNKYVDKTEEFKDAYNNVPAIIEIIESLSTPLTISNYKYRKEIEDMLNKKNYLENYQYAKYIINEYIKDPDSYNLSEFLNTYNISHNIFNYCVSLIEFIDPILYKEYITVKNQNIDVVNYENDIKLNNVVKKITEYAALDKELPLLEFFKLAPFTNNYGYYTSKIHSFINDDTTRNILIGYIAKKKIKMLNPINLNMIYKSELTFKGVKLSNTDIDNIMLIIEAYQLPQNTTVFNEVMDKYIKGHFNMSVVNEIIENRPKPVMIDIPYEFNNINSKGQRVLK